MVRDVQDNYSLAIQYLVLLGGIVMAMSEQMVFVKIV